MQEFIEKVNRRDPTWYCQNCNTSVSLGNVVRHQAICKEDDLDSSSSEEQETQSSQTARSKKNKTFTIDSSSEEEDNILDNPTASSSRTEATRKRSNELSSEEDTSPSNEPPPIPVNQRPKLIKRLKKSSEGNYEIIDEPNNNNTLSKTQDPYQFPDEFDGSDLETEVVISETQETEENLPEIRTKPSNWWDKIHDGQYIDHGYKNMNIFLKSDSKEFVDSTIQNWKKHESKKSELDRTRDAVENSDDQFKQFSSIRDQPILDEYTNFVTSHTTKDVLKIFSTDYEENSVQMGAKAATAKQYTYRIMEFFHFMADQYDNFHLDWFTDYEAAILKSYNGDVTVEIFIPTKQDLTKFIKMFKYGSNPAANCSIRIFALKKLIDFLIEKYQDNEHCFPGTIVQRSTLTKLLIEKLRNLNSNLVPDGTIKNISIASNRNHRQQLMEQMKSCPEKSLTNIMDGVAKYLDSDDYTNMKNMMLELAYKKTKVVTKTDYAKVTNWLLEQLICLGGNRPCALLGITVKDWQERRPGFYPFNQNKDNDLIDEDPDRHETRQMLRNPYQAPADSTNKKPTGIIVKSDTDKITIGPPCYIWFPMELVELVNAHSLIATRFLPRTVDLYHPNTRLFLNSNGKAITAISCTHFKSFIGLPITAYDFRRSLATYCFENKNQEIRKAEPSVLRHNQNTGFAYYYAKHSENVELVNVTYAVEHKLVRARKDDIDLHFEKLKRNGANDDWLLQQKREDKALEVQRENILKRRKSHNLSHKKGFRNFIMPDEYDAFLQAFDTAVQQELNLGDNPGPFYQLLKYLPERTEGGFFPPNKIWRTDFCRLLFGLTGPEGDSFRRADLNVYDGVPFSKLSGRQKILDAKENSKQSFNPYVTVSNYWREKIKDDCRSTKNGYWNQLKFLFNASDKEYYDNFKNK